MINTNNINKGELKMKDLYRVYYRTGGTHNFQWNFVLENFTKENATEKKKELEKMGYKALYKKKEFIEMIGLPETYE